MAKITSKPMAKSKKNYTSLLLWLFVILVGFMVFVTISILKNSQDLQSKASGCSTYNQPCASNQCCTNLRCTSFDGGATRLCKNTLPLCDTWCPTKTLRNGASSVRSTDSRTGGQCQRRSGVIVRGCVTYMQKILNGKKCDSGTPDGIFGPITKSAVIRFQGSNSLTQDGVVGPKTWGQLLRSTTKCSVDTGSAANPPSTGSIPSANFGYCWDRYYSKGVYLKAPLNCGKDGWSNALISFYKETGPCGGAPGGVCKAGTSAAVKLLPNGTRMLSFGKEVRIQSLQTGKIYTRTIQDMGCGWYGVNYWIDIYDPNATTTTFCAKVTFP